MLTFVNIFITVTNGELTVTNGEMTVTNGDKKRNEPETEGCFSMSVKRDLFSQR